MKEKQKKESNIGFILNRSGKHKFKIIFSSVFSIASAICKLFPYVLMYHILVELSSQSPNREIISKFVTYTIIASILSVLLQVLALGMSHIAAFSILFEIRKKTIERLGNLHLGFFRRYSIGQIKKAVDEDVEKLELFIAHQIPDLMESLIVPFVVITYLFSISWKLSLLLFIPFFIAIGAQAYMFKQYGERMELYNSYLKRMHSTIVQYIQGMSVFKAFNLTAKNFKIYKNTVDDYLAMWIQICDETVSKYSFGLSIIDSGGILICIPVGGLMYLNGSLNFAGFVMFLLLSSVFLTSFIKIMTLGGNLSMLLVGAENVREILMMQEQRGEDSPGTLITKGEITFEHVNFAYENTDVLHDFNLKIPSGTTTALVGPSGSGKTTVGMLIGRFWDVQRGSIKIDGHDIKEISVEELMKNTAFVFQDSFMINDSIYKNVIMGLDRTEEEVVDACKKAQIHNFIMNLKDGYDTLIGEDSGIKLSGGELQRISIARAILKNAKIVVLDEVTSYSDIENESLIQESIRNLLKGKTAVIIAHRLYTVKNSDCIVVLDEGKITEQGTHQELLEQGGLYQKLWNIGIGGEVHV